ncbi:Putative adenylate kinase-like protein C9orf98 [Echinococcus granulosus]|uniref:Adenylate kinase-like protein C9orf98 n=1 Tax=Echinococcus granulosus TaxID=6210 RepID=W6UNT4_ECHGR|nr:Putative adenylate kinase-like protein C9orf98 [Echinococcus granulosus]EUB63330.1 Putative adenylate kinase-like protein C9orf98 [Echinococcus granulosus]
MDRLERPIRIPPQFVDYVNKHSIFEIQKELLKRLIIWRPPDPITFLIDVLKSESLNSVGPSIFILGPPCVGKHTLGRHVARKLNCVHIPVRALRQAAEDNLIRQNNEGAIFYADYLRKRIEEKDCKTMGYVLTGFPMTEEEGKALQIFGIFPEKIIVLNASDNVLRSRVSGKVIDRLTKEPYHKLYNPPSDPEVESRLVPADDASDIDCRIAEFRHHFIAIGQMYTDIIVNLRGDQPLSDLYSQAICHLSRPARNPAMWTPRVLLLGFSGSGRKTVADKLAERYELIPVHCGTLIRREVIRETKLGTAMKIYVDAHSSGKNKDFAMLYQCIFEQKYMLQCPLPDEMVIKLLQARLSELDCTLKGWVLFGFPRTRLQAQMLDEVDLAPNRVLLLNIGHNDAAARLNVRRVDVVTGARYDLCLAPPPEPPVPMLERVAGRVGRPPGMAECEVSLKLTRHAAHRDELVEYYGPRVLNVNADREKETVFEQVESFLVNKMPRPARINPLANLKDEEKAILEEYFQQHHIMEIFESNGNFLKALLAGLCVMLPPRPRDWLKDSLKVLSSAPFLQLSSDVLIPEQIRPLTTGPWRRFDYRDFMLHHLGPPVDPWKMTIAREFSKRNDQRKCLRKWKGLIEDTKETESTDDWVFTARICYARKTMGKFLFVWRDYVQRRKTNIRAFCDMMKEVERNIRLSMSFQSLKASVFGAAQILPRGVCRFQRDWLTELPDRIQRMIFSHLTPIDFARCALVNQAWKVAVDLNAAAVDLDLSEIPNRATNALMLKLLHQRRKKVRKINLANCSLLTSSGLAALTLCANLQVVNLDNCSNVTVTSLGLITFAQAMGGIRRWILNNLPQLNDKVLETIGSRTALESLECRHSTTPTKHSVIQKQIAYFEKNDLQMKRVTSEGGTIKISSSKLKSLCIHGDNWLMDFGFRRLYPEKLTKLVVVNCPNVEDQIIGRLVKLENLRCLNLSHCYRLTDRCAALICGSSYASRLQELYLAYCYKLTDSGISPLIQKMASLFYLSLEGCSALTDEALIGVRNCRNLCWINISRTCLGDTLDIIVLLVQVAQVHSIRQ